MDATIIFDGQGHSCHAFNYRNDGIGGSIPGIIGLTQYRRAGSRLHRYVAIQR